MNARKTFVAQLLIVLVVLSSKAIADDELGVDRWVVPGTATGVVTAIADGSIWNILEESGLNDHLESQWPSSDPASPKDVFLNIYIKVSFFIESYVAKIQITRTGDQTWADAMGGEGYDDDDEEFDEEEEEQEEMEDDYEEFEDYEDEDGDCGGCEIDDWNEDTGEWEDGEWEDEWEEEEE